MNAPIYFVLPGPLTARTGGTIYDRRIVEGLRKRGRTIEVAELGGAYPFPSAAERARADAALVAIPDGAVAVVDGLAYGALPEAAERHSARLFLIALVHHPIADETGLTPHNRAALAASERRALACARRVIATSAFTGRRVSAYGVPSEKLFVVPPGTAQAPVAAGSGSNTLALFCAASYIPRKGHADLFRALAELADYPWQLVCAGKRDLDPATANALDGLIGDLGLAGRIELRSEVGESELERLYHGADLFVLASHYEGFGMALSEAVARGLPIVTTTGGALAETVPKDAALAVPPGDVAALRDALRKVLGEPALRARLAQASRAARAILPGWEDAVRTFGEILHSETVA